MSRGPVAATGIAAGLIVGLVAWTLRPVRVAMSGDTLRGFTAPIDQRPIAISTSPCSSAGTSIGTDVRPLSRQFFF